MAFARSVSIRATIRRFRRVAIASEFRRAAANDAHVCANLGQRGVTKRQREFSQCIGLRTGNYDAHMIRRLKVHTDREEGSEFL